MPHTNSVHSDSPSDIHTQKPNSTRSIGKQHSISVAKSPTTPSPTAKQHIFEKQNKTASLMALQAIAEQIAICIYMHFLEMK